MSQADILPLPVGVPETIPIHCSSIPGTFIVRTRTVVDKSFKEHGVTDFLKLCGRSNSSEWRRYFVVAAVGVRPSSSSAAL